MLIHERSRLSTHARFGELGRFTGKAQRVFLSYLRLRTRWLWAVASVPVRSDLSSHETSTDYYFEVSSHL